MSYSNLWCYSAKARLSKKAKTSDPTVEVDPEKTPEHQDEHPEVAMDSLAGPNQDGNANPPKVEPTAEADTSHPPALPSPAMEQRDSIADPPSPIIKPPSPSTKVPSPVRNIDSSSPAKMMMLLLHALHITPLVIRLFCQSTLLRMNLLP